MITRKYKNIKVFDSIEEDCRDNNTNFFDNLYSQEENHFWFIAKKEFVYKKDKIIGIDASTGNITNNWCKVW